MKEKHRCGAERGTKVLWLGFYRVVSLSFYQLDEQQKMYHPQMLRKENIRVLLLLEVLFSFVCSKILGGKNPSQVLQRKFIDQISFIRTFINCFAAHSYLLFPIYVYCLCVKLQKQEEGAFQQLRSGRKRFEALFPSQITIVNLKGTLFSFVWNSSGLFNAVTVITMNSICQLFSVDVFFHPKCCQVDSCHILSLNIWNCGAKRQAPSFEFFLKFKGLNTSKVRLFWHWALKQTIKHFFILVLKKTPKLLHCVFFSISAL